MYPDAVALQGWLPPGPKGTLFVFRLLGILRAQPRTAEHDIANKVVGVNQHFQHRKDIDGLRTVAILPVLLFHAGVPYMAGGFVGVDVFFVISGFLITGLIYRELHSGQFSLARFFERRLRRIFPALFFMMAVTTAVAWWVLMPNDFVSFGKSVVSTALSASNILFWTEDQYFAGPSELKPLLHTWSLGVEEQFYLFFPLLLIFFFRVTQKPGRAIASIAAASFVASIWAARSVPSAGFFLLPTRIWELALGSLLAIGGAPAINNLRDRWTSECLSSLVQPG